MVDLHTPILVVDDDATMRRTVRSMLRHMGFTDIHEDDGQDTMSVLRGRPFGLVLSDLMMKPVSGLALLKRVRAEPALAHLPFIMVTGAAQIDAVQTALSLGVDGYIAKPFNTMTLQRKVLGVLALAPSASPDVPRSVAAKAEAEESLTDLGKVAELTEHILSLLGLLHDRAQAGDFTPQQELVTVIRAYLDRAVGLGIEEEYREQFEAMLADLPARRLTQSPHVNGVLMPAGGAAGRSPAADRPGGSAAKSLAEPKGREGRHFIRYAAPRLQAVIGDRLYRTCDWSIGGICIAGYAEPVQPNTKIPVTLRITGIADPEAQFAGHCVVVRHDSLTGLLATRFESCLTPTLKILEYLARRGIRPRESELEAA